MGMCNVVNCTVNLQMLSWLLISTEKQLLDTRQSACTFYMHVQESGHHLKRKREAETGEGLH